MILAVVKRMEGAVVDTLTGKQIELPVDSLCIGVDGGDTKLNRLLMEPLRREAQGRA